MQCGPRAKSVHLRPAQRMSINDIPDCGTTVSRFASFLRCAKISPCAHAECREGRA